MDLKLISFQFNHQKSLISIITVIWSNDAIYGTANHLKGLYSLIKSDLIDLKLIDFHI